MQQTFQCEGLHIHMCGVCVCQTGVFAHSSIVLPFSFILYVTFPSYASCEKSLKKTEFLLASLSITLSHPASPATNVLERKPHQGPTPQGVFIGSFMWFFIIDLALLSYV